MIGAIYLFAGVFLTIRAVLAPFITVSPDFLQANNWLQTTVFGILVLLHIFLGICLPLMVVGRMQRTARGREERFRRLHESLRDAYAQVDLNGCLQDWNAGFRDMLGYSDEELRGLHLNDFSDPKWHEQGRKIIAEQVMPLGQSEVFEKEYVRKDGTVFPVELRAFLLRDDTDQPVAIWAIVRDITARKRQERELLALKNRLQATLDALPDLLFELDGAGRFISFHCADASALAVPP
jgi:PAS domain S-box-containing protein